MAQTLAEALAAFGDFIPVRDEAQLGWLVDMRRAATRARAYPACEIAAGRGRVPTRAPDLLTRLGPPFAPPPCKAGKSSDLERNRTGSPT